MTQDKNEVLANLYSIRAGMSAISIEKDRFVSEENTFKNSENDYAIANKNYKENTDSLIAHKNYVANYENTNYEADKTKVKFYFNINFLLTMSILFGTFAASFIIIVIGSAILDPLKGIFTYSGNRGTDLDMIWGKIAIVSLIISVSAEIFYLVWTLVDSLNDFHNVRKKSIEYYQKGAKEQEQNLQIHKSSLKKCLTNDLSLKQELELSEKEYSKQKDIFYNNKNNITISSKLLYNELIEQFQKVLDVRDWKHIDLVIFYFETGRAESIKEALQQVDRQVQIDSIVESVHQATQNICQNINVSMNNLRKDISKCFSNLSIQLASQHETQMNELKKINADIEKSNNLLQNLTSLGDETNKYLENMVSNESLNNALNTKINEDSLSLMKDVDFVLKMCA